MIKDTLWDYEHIDPFWRGWVLGRQLRRDSYEDLIKSIRHRIMIHWLKNHGYVVERGYWIKDGVKVRLYPVWSAEVEGNRFEIEDFPLWLMTNGFKRDGSCWVGHGLKIENTGYSWTVHGKGYLSNPEQIRKYMMEEVLKANGFVGHDTEWTRDGLRVYFDGEVWRIVWGHKAFPINDVKHLEWYLNTKEVTLMKHGFVDQGDEWVKGYLRIPKGNLDLDLERCLNTMENVLKANRFKFEGNAWIRGDLRVVFQGAWAIHIGGKRLTLTDGVHLESYLKAIERSEPRVKITEYANGVLVEGPKGHVSLVDERDGLWWCGVKGYFSKDIAVDAAKEKVLS